MLSDRAKALRPVIQAAFDAGGLDAIRQQPSRARPAHDQSAAKSIGMFPQRARSANVLCDPQLPLHNPQARPQPDELHQIRIRRPALDFAPE